MRMNDYAERRRWEVRSCPERIRCPLAFLCGAQSGNGRFILPAFVDVDYGEMAWVDLTPRSQVLVVRSGLFVSKVYANDGAEIPYAIHGRGFLSGLTEIYGPFTASNFYYLAGLVPGRLCAFDADVVEERVNGLSSQQGQALTAQALLNQTTATYGQVLTLAHGNARDRVASTLVRLDDLLGREEGYEGVLPIAQNDIAAIASLERSTVGHELRALASEGMVSLGYRNIRVLAGLRERYGGLIEANLPFYDQVVVSEGSTGERGDCS